MKKLIFLILLSLPIMAQVFDRNGYGNDSGTELLLHMDGVNDGTVFTDASKNNFTVTNDSILTVTADKVFGTASGHKDGYYKLTVQDNNAWDITTKNFTIDFRIKIIGTLGAYNYFVHTGTAADGWIIYFDKLIPAFKFSVQQSNVDVISVNSTSTIFLNTWYHIAITKNDSIYSFYLNGNLEDVDTNTVTLETSSGLSIFDPFWCTSSRKMLIDEFRYSNFCRWNKNFTPPNRAY